MQMFKTTRAYLVVFCLYILNALIVCYPLRANSQANPFVYSSYFLIANILGGLFCLMLFLSGIRKTSSLVEKFIMILSGLFFVLFITDNIHKLGYAWAFVPLRHSISAVVICAAAILTGIRLLQVLIHQNKMAGGPGLR